MNSVWSKSVPGPVIAESCMVVQRKVCCFCTLRSMTLMIVAAEVLCQTQQTFCARLRCMGLVLESPKMACNTIDAVQT